MCCQARFYLFVCLGGHLKIAFALFVDPHQCLSTSCWSAAGPAQCFELECRVLGCGDH